MKSRQNRRARGETSNANHTKLTIQAREKRVTLTMTKRTTISTVTLSKVKEKSEGGGMLKSRKNRETEREKRREERAYYHTLHRSNNNNFFLTNFLCVK